MADLVCINVIIKHRSSNNWDSLRTKTGLFRYYEKYNLWMVFDSALAIYKVTEECPSPELIVTADITTFQQEVNILSALQYRQEKWWMPIISLIMSSLLVITSIHRKQGQMYVWSQSVIQSTHHWDTRTSRRSCWRSKEFELFRHLFCFSNQNQ